MSIADELNKLIPGLEEAYAAIEEVGGTLPEQKNFKNLKVAIESIPGGAPDAYVFLYDPNNPAEMDYTDDPQDIINIMRGSGYLPNNGYTNIKFTPKCQELNITSIGNNVTLSPNIEVVEGLENFTKVTSIGSFFLSGSDTTSPNNSLREVKALPPNVTSITSAFLYCNRLNCPINLPSGLRSIGTGILVYCPTFNSPITFPDTLQSLGGIYNLDAFNQPLTLPSSLSTIRANFLSHMKSFNQPIALPCTPTQNFLYDCAVFDSPVTLPSGTTAIVAGSFRDMPNFNQEITIPDTVTAVGQNAFTGLPNLTAGINATTSRPVFESSNAFYGFENDPCYSRGVNIRCENGNTRTHWQAQLPDVAIGPLQPQGRTINWS